MSHELEEDHNGMFGLCVFHAENVPEEEIRKIFGKFGPVSKINRTSFATFVHYNSRENAANCLVSMQNDPQLNVRAAKSKNKSNNAGRNTEGRGGEMSRGGESRGDSRGWRPNSAGGSDFGQSGSRGGAAALPPMPKLIPFPCVPPASKDRPVAKMVVIANLHPDLKQCNVYELCSKAKTPPLHIAMRSITRPPYPTIPYAYAYVRNDVEVKNLVDGLNNLKVKGYKLFVNSFDKLAEEGMPGIAGKI